MQSSQSSFQSSSLNVHSTEIMPLVKFCHLFQYCAACSKFELMHCKSSVHLVGGRPLFLCLCLYYWIFIIHRSVFLAICPVPCHFIFVILPTAIINRSFFVFFCTLYFVVILSIYLSIARCITPWHVA